MSPRKFLKNLSILSIFASILVGVGYSTYVYADKYVWTNLASPTTNWQAVAMANNSYGYAGVGSDLYYTNNGGSSWNYLNNLGGAQYPIRSIATSESGDYVLVSYDDIMSDGGFSVSNSYGGSLTVSAPYNAEYYGVAMSEGGQYMYVTDQTNTRLLYSNNFGQSGTWNYSNLSYTPTSVAVSNDGMYVYTATGAYILRSADYGANNNISGPSNNYMDVAVSANGQYVYAVPGSGYPIYSSDYGVNFSELTNAGSRSWKSVSVSGDGSRVVLVDNYGSGSQVYSSRDYGATFMTENSGVYSLWNDVSLSSDGYIALLASSDSYLYTGNWDVVAPSIIAVISNTANGTYKLGSTIQLQVNSIEPLYDSSLNLTLETGTTDRSCSGAFSVGNTVMNCSYTVQAGDTTSDLGTNAISGTLTDDAGNSRINDFSGALNYLASSQSIVIDGVVPTVSLTAPSNGSTASSTVSLTATASDVGTGLAGVQFRVGTTSIGAEDTSSPYTASWNSTAVADGSYTLHAVARDVAGNYATSSVTITVDNTAPAAPGTPDLVASSDTGNSNSDNITASTTPQFTSSCITGSTVRFYQGGSTLIGTATCSATSSATIISSTTFTSGSHVVTARQSDAVGNQSVASTGLTVTIDSVAPAISITVPIDGSYGFGTISLVASSSDSISSIYGVLFRNVNSGAQIGTEDTTSPYVVSWDTTSTIDGSTVVRATATDIAGNTASTTVTVIVDNTAPAAPTSLDLATLSDTGASTTDNFTSDVTPDISTSCENSATVRLYRAGSTLIGSGTCSSGAVTITSSTLAEGAHTITSLQTDLAGNTSSASAALSITIDNATGPSVSLTSPTTGATVNGTISIDATATDALTSVVGVLFSHGTTTIGSEDTSSPYSVSLDTTTLTDGAYTLNAVARDIVGNYSTSTISVTISNAVTASDSGATQSSGPTAYSTAPSSPIPGIYNPTGNSAGNEKISPTKVLASAIVQSAGINSNFNFTKNATIRSINNEVINIQRMLNTMGYTVATTGVGSKGNESSFFGQRTRLALIRFQKAFAIPATGFFGPLSRAAMNRILNSVR